METIRAQRYDQVAIAIHWLTAIGIIGNIILGHVMEALPLSYRPVLVPIHSWIGLTILLLTLFRIMWRVTHPKPASPVQYSLWEKRLAAGAHYIFYGLMIVLPVSGYLLLSANPPSLPIKLTYFKLIEIPFFQPFRMMEATAQKILHDDLVTAHAIGGWLIVATLALHILGVIKHHIVDHDRIIQRMNPF